MKVENYELPDKVAGKDELIDANGKPWGLEVSYSEADDEYRWAVSNGSLERNGCEATLELAVEAAVQVYRDYMERVG